MVNFSGNAEGFIFFPIIETMISMIHNSSSDPVLIKKISLKIWSLRDEIEARIQEKVDSGAPFAQEDMMQIQGLYTPKSANSSDNVLSLKANEQLDTDEDEMARAMAGLEAVEAATEEGAEASEESADNVVSISPGSPTISNENPNIITISLNAPNIPEEKMSKGKTVLSEISMDKMFFFCNKPFTEGQSIVIQFCIPKSFIVNADILYCRPFNLKSRIISENNYTHRALIRFKFLKEGERALLRQFLQSIEPEIVKVEKKADTSKDDDGGDFNELDDLGL